MGPSGRGDPDRQVRMQARGSQVRPDGVPPEPPARSAARSRTACASGPQRPWASAAAGSTSPPVPLELLRTACVRSPSGMTVWSPEGRVLWCNQAFADLVGYGCEDLVGRAHAALIHPDDAAAEAAVPSAPPAGGSDMLEHEQRYLHRDGSAVWASVRVQLIRDDAGKLVAFVSHVRDITDRRRAQQLLEDSGRMLRAVIDNTPAVICVKGRDHRYRLVNREFELRYGRTSDWIIGRLDADLLAPSALADIHAKDLAVIDSGCSSREETAVREGSHLRVILTTRFPLANAAGEIDAVCLAATDITERRAEEHSRRERLECSEMVYSALAEDRLVLYAQPIVGLRAPRPMGAELLIRMRDRLDATKLLAPSAFIPAAERHGLIGVIDEWVIARALTIARERPVTVNVSASTISDESRVEDVERAICTSRTAPGNLVFEITETAVSEDLDAAHRFAIRMRRLGCGIALDDFGVGHGSFTYLRRLPVDYLKIDTQFVRAFPTSAEDRQIVTAIIGVARQFGLRTIAEGVEDQDTLDGLHRLGVDFVQGYFTGRPMPLGDCWNLIGTPPQGAAHV
ncbi:MAG TPA: EAL domain-containing protein [Solirubrobacteraceae bacterium]|nr:EAL domain-containing protein [Solirubrobacteraceae bacterium]